MSCQLIVRSLLHWLNCKRPEINIKADMRLGLPHSKGSIYISTHNVMFCCLTISSITETSKVEIMKMN